MSMNTVPNLAGGGEPPYDREMDRRLTVLETRFDTILPTLATKADVAALRAEVMVGFEQLRADQLKLHNSLLKWIVGMFVTLFIGMLGSNVALFNAINHIASDRTAVQQSPGSPGGNP
ncbi:MAG: hypothetical protein V4484_09190 [Pseudomonadota bacterium]